MTPDAKKLYTVCGGERDKYIFFDVGPANKYERMAGSSLEYIKDLLCHPLPFERVALLCPSEGDSSIAMFVHQENKHTHVYVGVYNVEQAKKYTSMAFHMWLDDEKEFRMDYPPALLQSLKGPIEKLDQTAMWFARCWSGIMHTINTERIPGARPEVNPEYRKTLKYKMRKQRGQPMPLEHISWNTVELPAPVYVPKPHQGGTHASPRAHDRRGHFRTYASGKRVWVRNARVGDAALGIVLKDYEVK